MLTVRRANDRGHVDHGWLDARHTFSFGAYRDPHHDRFRALRVMNEDRIAPGRGFGMHPHRDMEIVTLVLEGALEHEDSTGGGGVLRPGELQHMSAGTGVYHSEQNASATEPVHLYQIWLLPDREGVEPRYEQKRFDPAEQANRLRMVASPDGADGSLRVHQDARLYLSTLEPGATEAHKLGDNRHAWLQMLRGSVDVAGEALTDGDGAAISGESVVEIATYSGAEVLLFDLG